MMLRHARSRKRACTHACASIPSLSLLCFAAFESSSNPSHCVWNARLRFRIICCAPCVVRDALREVKQKQESWRKGSQTSTEQPPTPPPSPPDAQDGRGDDMQSQSEPTPLTWHGRDFSNESLEYLISRSFRPERAYFRSQLLPDD